MSRKKGKTSDVQHSGGWRALHQHQPQPREVASSRQRIDAEMEPSQIRLRVAGRLPSGSVIARVGKLFLARVLVPAATVFVVGPHGGVIVAGDAGYRFGGSARRSHWAMGRTPRDRPGGMPH